MKSQYPEYLGLYSTYDENIKRADAFRYFVLHHYGGLYVDLDFECLRPFEPLLDDAGTCIMGIEPKIHAERLYNRDRLICNALMASPPGHRFWSHTIDCLVAYRGEKDVLDATGPRMLDNAHKTYPHRDVVLKPSSTFYPVVDWDKKGLLNDMERRHYARMVQDRSYPDESYAVHHWAGTWNSQRIIPIMRRLSIRLKSRIGRLFRGET